MGIRGRIACGSPGNWAQWCDPDVDRLLDEGAAEVDSDKRHEVYRELLTLLQEQAYLYSGYMEPLVAVHHKDVRGMKYNFMNASVREAWLDT